jgi:hypothetical protein
MHAAPSRVLVRDRRAEQGHHPVARVLIDGPLEAVNLGRDHLEAALEDAVHVLGVELLGQRCEAREVGEEHGHLSSLALECRAIAEDLLGQVFRRVRGDGARRHRDGCRAGRSRGQGGQAGAALTAELEAGGNLGATLRAAKRQGRAALTAEAHPGRVLEPALGARRHLGLPLQRVRVDPVLGQLLAQRVAVDPEDLGGAHLIAARLA